MVTDFIIFVPFCLKINVAYVCRKKIIHITLHVCAHYTW